MFECAFEVVVFHFVEAIHVELSDEAVHFFMSEVAREDDLLEFDYISNNKFSSIGCPIDYLLVLLDLNKSISTPNISKVL